MSHITARDSLPTVGGIQLPAFIVLLFFGPFALSFLIFVIYTFTVKRYKDKKQLNRQAEIEEGRNANPDVEIQVQQVRELARQPTLIQKPAPTQQRRG